MSTRGEGKIKGHVRPGRRSGTWYCVLDLGYITKDGKRQRQRKWVTVKAKTEKQAISELGRLTAEYKKGEIVSASKMTVGEWVTIWLDRCAGLRESTIERYRGIINSHLVPSLGAILLQELRPDHVTDYYREKGKTLSRGTVDLHHLILKASLRSALKSRRVAFNAVIDAEGRAKRKKGDRAIDPTKDCWTPEEAQKVLAAAKAADPQSSALFALALNTGMRRGELLALAWDAVDLENATVRVHRTLLKSGREPKFGDTKTGVERTIGLDPETVRRLAEHKRAQAELKMKNRQHYHEIGLVFAKTWGDLHGRQDSLGLPLQASNIGNREFARVVKAAGVRRIKFHGMRHTCATLMLGAGEAVHVVAARLGHAKVTTTLEVYAHALPKQGQDAADRLGAVLYGG
jgi:integrase